MAQLILLPGIRNKRCRISTTYDHGRPVLRSFDASFKQRIRSLCEGWELEDPCRTVPQDGLGFQNGLCEDLVRFGSAVETLPVGGDTSLVGRLAGLPLAERMTKPTFASLSNLSAVM